jgi:hypothetical protein
VRFSRPDLNKQEGFISLKAGTDSEMHLTAKDGGTHKEQPSRDFAEDPGSFRIGKRNDILQARARFLSFMRIHKFIGSGEKIIQRT